MLEDDKDIDFSSTSNSDNSFESDDERGFDMSQPTMESDSSLEIEDDNGESVDNNDERGFDMSQPTMENRSLLNDFNKKEPLTEDIIQEPKGENQEKTIESLKEDVVNKDFHQIHGNDNLDSLSKQISEKINENEETNQKTRKEEWDNNETTYNNENLGNNSIDRLSDQIKEETKYTTNQEMNEKDNNFSRIQRRDGSFLEVDKNSKTGDHIHYINEQGSDIPVRVYEDGKIVYDQRMAESKFDIANLNQETRETFYLGEERNEESMDKKEKKQEQEFPTPEHKEYNSDISAKNLKENLEKDNTEQQVEKKSQGFEDMDIKVDDPFVLEKAEIRKNYFPNESEQESENKTIEKLNESKEELGKLHEITEQRKEFWNNAKKELQELPEYKKFQEEYEKLSPNEPLSEDAKKYFDKCEEFLQGKLLEERKKFHEDYFKIEESLIHILSKGEDIGDINFPTNEYEKYESVCKAFGWDKETVDKIVESRRMFNKDAIDSPFAESYALGKLFSENFSLPAIYTLGKLLRKKLSER